MALFRYNAEPADLYIRYVWERAYDSASSYFRVQKVGHWLRVPDDRDHIPVRSLALVFTIKTYPEPLSNSLQDVMDEVFVGVVL